MNSSFLQKSLIKCRRKNWNRKSPFCKLTVIFFLYQKMLKSMDKSMKKNRIYILSQSISPQYYLLQNWKVATLQWRNLVDITLKVNIIENETNWHHVLPDMIYWEDITSLGWYFSIKINNFKLCMQSVCKFYSVLTGKNWTDGKKISNSSLIYKTGEDTEQTAVPKTGSI